MKQYRNKGLNRFILTGCLFLFSSLLACKQKNEPRPEPKIAKTVPAVIHLSTDTLFKVRQDTIFYQGVLYSGFICGLYEKGDSAFIYSYFNGVEEGWQRKWYDNGRLAEQRFYINGKKEGLHRGWWPDGKDKFYTELSDDQFDGAIREWNSSGLLIKSFHYTKGTEDGPQRLWWDNGKVRANFVTKKGRRYGLIGLKTCANPYDSVIQKQ